VRHPRKLVWLLHQFRQAWDLDRTAFGQFSESAEDRALRRRVLELERTALGEARALFATSGNVARRLRESTGLDAEVMPHPPAPLAYRCDEPGDYVFTVNRLAPEKRVDLLVEAVAAEPSLRAVVAGDGPDRPRLERLAAERGLNGRVDFVGRVSDERLADLYAGALGVFYAPVDEDFGMVPFVAFLSGKPVLTTTDAGGPLDVVHDRETGLVVAPDPVEVGRGLAWLCAHAEDARAYGARGRELAAAVTWDSCIERLLAAAS
jgi:glycosyltransferase involved in cell wall biosynthesis